MGRFTTSSDRDNSVNIRSILNRRSLRSLSITATAFMIVIAFSSLSSVLSFPVSPSSWNKITLAQRHGQPQLLQSSSFAFTIKQQKHPLHTRFGAAPRNDCKDKDPPTSSVNTPAQSTTIKAGSDDGYDGLGDYDPSENLPQTERAVPNVGNPQLRVKEKDWSVTNILKELAAIQQQGPQKYCILGTRHCSYLHQQIIELLYVFSFRQQQQSCFLCSADGYDNSPCCLQIVRSCAHVLSLFLTSFVGLSRTIGPVSLAMKFDLSLRAYALVLSGNHVYTSGAPGTNGKETILPVRYE